jgi:hypothetical protein
MSSFERETNILVPNYCTFPFSDGGKLGYSFILNLAEKTYADYLQQESGSLKATWTDKLEKILKDQNQDYRECVDAGILHPLRIRVLSDSYFSPFVRKQSAHGQLKVPRVFQRSDDMLKFYLEKLNVDLLEAGLV